MSIQDLFLRVYLLKFCSQIFFAAGFAIITP